MEKEKKSKGEKAMEKAIASFMKYQRKADERFQKLEEERWLREAEVEKRRDEREHEIRLLGQN